MLIKENLLVCCRRYILASDNVVIREPYIPYVPDEWNGVLVLAESQNLSSSNSEYVEHLRSLTEEQRMMRLGIDNDGEVGVYPWDDGSLKLAVEVAFSKKAERTAVSNAVLWSQRGDSGQNVTPDGKLKDLSAKLWTEMLGILNPELVICSGNVAESIITTTTWSGDRRKLRLPSPTAMSRISGMFEEDDLLRRYPEVKTVINTHPEWLDKGYRKNKIFFACHAASLYANSSD